MASEEDIYSTQPSDDQDKAIYLEIKSKLGQNDKKSFESGLTVIYDWNVKEINHIRESIYDYGKDVCENVPAGLLVRRRAKKHGAKAVFEKYAQDIYFLFNFIEGGIQDHVLQNKVLSKASLRHLSTSQIYTEDDKIQEKAQGEITSNNIDVLLGHYVQLKQCVSKGSENVADRLTHLESKFDREISKNNDVIQEQNLVIQDLTVRLEASEERRVELRSELKLQAQESKTLKDKINDLEHELMRANHQVDNKLKTIDNKITNLSDKLKNSQSPTRSVNTTPQSHDKGVQYEFRCEQVRSASDILGVDSPERCALQFLNTESHSVADDTETVTETTRQDIAATHGDTQTYDK